MVPQSEREVLNSLCYSIFLGFIFLGGAFFFYHPQQCFFCVCYVELSVMGGELGGLDRLNCTDWTDLYTGLKGM